MSRKERLSFKKRSKFVLLFKRVKKTGAYASERGARDLLTIFVDFVKERTLNLGEY